MDKTSRLIHSYCEDERERERSPLDRQDPGRDGPSRRQDHGREGPSRQDRGRQNEGREGPSRQEYTDRREGPPNPTENPLKYPRAAEVEINALRRRLVENREEKEGLKGETKRAEEEARIAEEEKRIAEAKMKIMKIKIETLEAKAGNAEEMNEVIEEQQKQLGKLRDTNKTLLKRIAELTRSPMNRNTSLSSTEEDKLLEDKRLEENMEGEAGEEPPKDPLMEGEWSFDSHFHLDRLHKKVGPSLTLEQLSDTPKYKPPFFVPVGGGMLNFCDPNTYPSLAETREIEGKKEKWGVSIGVHPSHPKARVNLLEVGKYIETFREEGLLRGLGEIGFDWGWTQNNSIKDQETIVEHIVSKARVDVPLILHVRGYQDRHSRVAYEHCLEFLKGRVNKQQTIQLHCFHGSKETMDKWSKYFPNTFFSISGSFKFFDKEQKDMILGIPLNRMLLETDSPYLALRRGHNTPQLLGEIAENVAGIKGISRALLLKHCNRNALNIFHLL